jgi:CubicO group peptidase (beta-lactamase class C family)
MARTATVKKAPASKKNGHLVTPSLPRGKPESVGLSSAGLKRISDVLKREIHKGTMPGAVVMVGRRGKIAHFDALGVQDPATQTPMRHDSVFRVFSMTKPITSVAVMQLVEDGKMLISDPVSKYFPAFAKVQVGVPRDGKLHLVPAEREITIQDLLRHTSGLVTHTTGTGPVETLYAEAGISARTRTNKENAELLATLPLDFQPGSEWKYSRSTDLLGSIIEVVSGQTLGGYLTEHIFAPLRMTDTGFYISKDRAGERLAEAFAHDPWTGEKVSHWSMTEKPALEAGGGGLVATTMDYARFAQMLVNGGTLDGARIIGRKTLEWMTSNHLAPNVKVESPLIPPGHGFGLGFAVRLERGMAPFPGSVGKYYWGGRGGTQFWVDPKENLFALLMVQAPGQRNYLRILIRDLVYAAVES